MRILLSCILTLLLFQAIAQDSDVTLELSNKSMEEILLEIESQTGLKFFYTKEWLEGFSANGTINKRQPIPLLTELLNPLGLTFIIRDENVILLPNDFVNRNETDLKEPSETIGISINRELNIGIDASTIEIGQPGNGSGQNSTIAGYVNELSTGEPIIGALVFVKDPFVGTTTDGQGFFSISLPNGSHELRVQFVGLEEITQNITLYSDGELNFDMTDEVIALKEITIESERDANISQVQLGVNSIDVSSIKNVPLVLGEPDVLKVATTLPGVQTVGEAATGFNVRGGNADQNLILLDGATIYNPSHFFGFFSILNSNAIKKLDLYKSTLPVKYGGRLSSVFDLKMIDGNKKEISVEGSVSIATAGINVQGPIVKDKTSFLLGARTTYSDWVLNLVPESSSISNTTASFQDLVGKVSHQINENNSISVMGYYSRDQFQLSSDSLFSYRNTNSSVTWRRNFNNRLVGELTGSYNEYDYNINFDETPVESFESGFNIKDQNVLLDFGYFLDNHRLDFGVQVKRYEIEPGSIQPASAESLIEAERVDTENGLESAFYLSDRYEFNDRLSVNAGLRYTIFNALGPGVVNIFSDEASRSLNTRIDSISVGKNEVIKTYHGPEARLSGRYLIGNEASVKIGYSRSRQFIHQLSNTIAIAPTDTWKLSDVHIEPQVGDQISIGYFRNFNASSIEASVEGYYKKLQNILDFKNGADLSINQSIETDAIQGEGRGYGVEFFVKKKRGKFNGWISYTYSRIFSRFRSQFDEETLNNGVWFPANFDKPHSLTAVTNYRLTRRYSLSANLTFSTGRPITFPIAKFEFGRSERIQFSERNEFRIPNLFRIDIGFNIDGNHKLKKLSHSYWNISVYNLLGRRNPYSIFFQTNDGQIEARRLSIFGAPIPTVTYHFKF